MPNRGTVPRTMFPTMLECALVLALLGTFALATASGFGLQPPRAHAAALALEAALVEARSVATETADLTDPAAATGATVYVEPDPADPQNSYISVYRSRPIPDANPGARPAPLARDTGFPRQRAGGRLTVDDGAVPATDRFAILISTSGYASVAAPQAWDPGKSAAVLTSDPGCADGAVTIAAADALRSEVHPFACRDAIYDAAH